MIIKSILLDGSGEQEIEYTSTAEYRPPEKVRVIEGGDFYEFLLGKNIYLCDNCGHTWIDERELMKGDGCPACEEGQL